MELDQSTKDVEDMDTTEVKEMSYEDKLGFVNAISQPMAPKKLTKKIYKCIKKGTNLQLFNLQRCFISIA